MSIILTILLAIVAYIAVGVAICIAGVRFGIINPYDEDITCIALIVFVWPFISIIALIVGVSDGFMALLEKIYDEREKEQKDTEDEENDS